MGEHFYVWLFLWLWDFWMKILSIYLVRLACSSNTFSLNNLKILLKCFIYFEKLIYFFVGCWGGGGGLELITWQSFALMYFVILSILVSSPRVIYQWNFALVDVYWNNQQKSLKYAVESNMLSLMYFWILNASKMVYRHGVICYILVSEAIAV